MTPMQGILLAVFVVSTIVGYFLIRQIPSLLHTPLMSGMNALSGITVLGAITATAVLISMNNFWLAAIAGGAAIILAMVNVVGGFGVTDRMLGMIVKRKNKKGGKN
ncbi:MAG: NAD(P) transhydrogenase subunit alpha [Clostridiales bacterium]|jgi:NAD(P) transhydrogenase subunit alpha|nr:NAD(P) transhydrogenase subunit alpha [Clostridiales bacterium]